MEKFISSSLASNDYSQLLKLTWENENWACRPRRAIWHSQPVRWSLNILPPTPTERRLAGRYYICLCIPQAVPTPSCVTTLSCYSILNHYGWLTCSTEPSTLNGLSQMPAAFNPMSISTSCTDLVLSTIFEPFVPYIFAWKYRYGET